MIRVLCVDDNQFVLQALERRLALEPDLLCVGTCLDACDLEQKVAELRPDVVLLDLDMPYRDPLEALTALTEQMPEVRILILSGHVKRALIERAIEGGAMGYVAKNEDVSTVVDAIRSVAAGAFVLGPECEAELGGP
jgi:DNA-binding NarL/FixJ family response regulator